MYLSKEWTYLCLSMRWSSTNYAHQSVRIYSSENDTDEIDEESVFDLFD